MFSVTLFPELSKLVREKTEDLPGHEALDVDAAVKQADIVDARSQEILAETVGRGISVKDQLLDEITRAPQAARQMFVSLLKNFSAAAEKRSSQIDHAVPARALIEALKADDLSVRDHGQEALAVDGQQLITSLKTISGLDEVGFDEDVMIELTARDRFLTVDASSPEGNTILQIGTRIDLSKIALDPVSVPADAIQFFSLELIDEAGRDGFSLSFQGVDGVDQEVKTALELKARPLIKAHLEAALQAGLGAKSTVVEA